MNLSKLAKMLEVHPGTISAAVRYLNIALRKEEGKRILTEEQIVIITRYTVRWQMIKDKKRL
jgi:hypothetical protein